MQMMRAHQPRTKMCLTNAEVDDDALLLMIVGNGAGDDGVNDCRAVVVVVYLRTRKDVYQPFCYCYYWLL